MYRMLKIFNWNKIKHIYMHVSLETKDYVYNVMELF